MTRLGIITGAALSAALLALCSCGGRPAQSRCDVEVYTPNPQYSDVALLGVHGEVLDSTLSVRNDSVLFSRTDSLRMPYVATLRLRNPDAELDALYMPLVIEGGTVRMELTETSLELTGTPGNGRLIKFIRAKNRLMSELREKDPDPQAQKEELSRFFTSQALDNRDNIVGEYILDTYSEFMLPDDLRRVREAIDVGE